MSADTGVMIAPVALLALLLFLALAVGTVVLVASIAAKHRMLAPVIGLGAVGGVVLFLLLGFWVVALVDPREHGPHIGVTTHVAYPDAEIDAAIHANAAAVETADAIAEKPDGVDDDAIAAKPDALPAEPDDTKSTADTLSERPETDDRPAWVQEPVNEPHRRTVSSGWHPNRVESRRALVEQLQKTLNERMNETLAEPKAAERIGVTPADAVDFIERHAPESYEETKTRLGEIQELDREFGPVTLYQSHLLVDFATARDFDEMAKARYAQWQTDQEQLRRHRQVQKRTGAMAVLLGGLLSLIAVLWGFLKLNASAAGRNHRGLQIAAAIAILAVVALGLTLLG